VKLEIPYKEGIF